CHRLHQHHPGSHGCGRGYGTEPDGPASEHDHGVRCIRPADQVQRVVSAAERLYQCALLVGDSISQLVDPIPTHLEELGEGTVHRETDVVDAAVHVALADDPVARSKTPDLRTDRHHIAGPFVAGDHGERDGNDVLAGEQIEVRVTDAYVARSDQ